jgi:hypothetical protein
MLKQQENLPVKLRSQKKVDRNERMTAIAGAVLFVFIIVELFVTANLHALLTEHIFVGILLCGPLIVKMLSTGYRFIRYYAKTPVFVKKGPPNIILRLLAPFFVIITILVFVSGFGLVYTGDKGLFIKIHAVSVTLWIPLLAVHIYAYIRKVKVLITSDWARKSKNRVQGRKGRLGMNIAGLMTGAVAAIMLLPTYAHGSGGGHHGFFHSIPGPLSAGLLASILAVLIAIPLLRFTNKHS